MIRWMFVVLFGFIATNSYSQEIQVVVDEQDYFVIQGESLELLGFQLESPSGSLIPNPNADSSPFQFYLANKTTTVGLGSLGETVSVSGSLKLPTQWNSAGQKDVGFLWGNLTEDGWGAVEGHDYEFVEPQRGSAVSPELVPSLPAPTIPEDSDGDTGIIVIEDDVDLPSDLPGSIDTDPIEETNPGTGPEPTVPTEPSTTTEESSLHSFVLLEPTRSPMRLYLEGAPDIRMLTVKSEAGLLDYEFLSANEESPLVLVSQDAFSASFVPTTTTVPDGSFALPLAWSGQNDLDLGMEFDKALGAEVFVEVLPVFASSSLPEPACNVMLMSILCLLPAFRARKRC